MDVCTCSMRRAAREYGNSMPVPRSRRRRPSPRAASSLDRRTGGCTCSVRVHGGLGAKSRPPCDLAHIYPTNCLSLQGTHLARTKSARCSAPAWIGEVYRARDTKLDRDAAIKVLPDTFAHDPERLARFSAR